MVNARARLPASSIPTHSWVTQTKMFCKFDLGAIFGMLSLRISISRNSWPTVVPFHFQSYWPVIFGPDSLLFLNYFFMFWLLLFLNFIASTFFFYVDEIKNKRKCFTIHLQLHLHTLARLRPLTFAFIHLEQKEQVTKPNHVELEWNQLTLAKIQFMPCHLMLLSCGYLTHMSACLVCGK